jgi:GNAT superfamily N-acetyltransferase
MTRPARKPLPRPKVSASGAPDFQEESLVDIASELTPLLVRYGAEIYKAPLDPDWQGLFRMTAMGALKTITARIDGLLVGFACSNVLPHIMFKSTPHGITFAVFMDKEYRGHGYKLLRFNRDFLLALGCKRLCISTDARNPRLGKVYERLGYKFDETSYAGIFA